MSDKILIALDKLDPAVDEQWTADGLPVVAVVQELAEDESITRKMITDVAPFFTRDVAAGSLPEDNKDGPAEEDEGPKMASAPAPARPAETGQPRLNPRYPDLKPPAPEEIEKEIDQLNTDMAAVTQEITEAKKRLGEMRNRFDQIVSWRDAGKSADPHANQREIMMALKRSQEERQRRADVHYALMAKLKDDGPQGKAVASTVAPIEMPIERKGKKKGR